MASIVAAVVVVVVVYMAVPFVCDDFGVIIIITLLRVFNTTVS